MWGWLRALVEGIVAPLLQWWQTYDQGRNAEQAKASQAAAAQSARIADAQSHVEPVRVDADWLHRGSHPEQAPDLRST